MPHCKAIPTMLEMTKYSARPEANCEVKYPNISGIMRFMVLFMDACCGSDPAWACIDIFCCKYIVPPTRIGNTIGDGSGSARFSHRNRLCSGMISAKEATPV